MTKTITRIWMLIALLLMATAAFTYGIGLWLDRIGNECSEKQKECTDRKQ